MKNLYKLLPLCLLVLSSQLATAQISMYSQNAANRAAYYNWLQYQKTKAAGGNLLKWWHGEETIGTIFSGPLHFTDRNKYDSVEYVSTPSHDSTIKGVAQGKIGLHINGNANYMLARLSPNSILTFSWGMQIDVQRWSLNAFVTNSLEVGERSLLRAQAGIPLTVEYKSGCDVDFDPEAKTCFAVGGGVMPMAYGSFLDGISDHAGYRIAPYAYASFGFYVLGCWKIRAAFIPGKYTLFDNLQSTGGGTVTTFTAHSSNMFMIGVSHMAWSRDWSEGRGTRGSHHGFGGRPRHFHANGRMF